MNKKELLNKLSELLREYETSNNNDLKFTVGAFIDLGDGDHYEWYEFTGDSFLRFRGEIDKVLPDGN